MPLDIRNHLKLSEGRKLSAVRKSVGMVSNINSNAMMETLLMAMVAAAHVLKNLDGSAVEDHQASLVSARNSFQIKSNSHQRVPSIWVDTS